MIICPACREEIEDDSHYCDQCGQQLLFCKQCGHVGLGRRCTRCGGMMALRQGDGVEMQQNIRPEVNIGVQPAQPISRVSPVQPAQRVASIPNATIISSPSNGSNKSASISVTPGISIASAGPARGGLPVMTLVNDGLNIRITAMNGAIIGRRKGPYVQFFEQHSYVSGVHAQLKYKSGAGWCVIDKNSSNGTRVNQNPIQPEVETALKNGDMLTIANIELQVIIR